MFNPKNKPFSCGFRQMRKWIGYLNYNGTMDNLKMVCQVSKINRNKKRGLLRIGGILCASTLAVSIGYASFASNGDTNSSGSSIPYSNVGNTPLAYSYNISSIASGNFALNSSENMDLMIEAKEEAQKAAAQTTAECADPDKPGGLGEVQKNQIENERKRDLTSVDLDKIFKYGDKNGCFNALGDFPDLSINIPGVTGILNSIKDTLVKYATRKACAVVDEALEGALGPIKDTMDDISDRGMLDLSGRVNKEILGRMYEIDPELGRVSTTSKPHREDEVEFKW